MRTLVAVAITFTLSSGVAAPQSPAPVTPEECVKAGRELARRRLREAGPAAAELVRKIDAERVEMVRACAAPFGVEKAQPRDLAGIVELYTEAQQPELAERAIARGLALERSAPAERAGLLSAAVRFLLRQPKSPERNARAERYMGMLDALPDEALEQKLAAHASLNGYYRGDDIDEGIIKHSSWLIDTAKRLGPEQRRRFSSGLISAYVNLAEALAGQGENDRAVELLKRAAVDLADLPDVPRRTKGALGRCLLVGTPAAPITAPVWLNAPDGTQAMAMKGGVTLLEFTAHWCGPCKESYPGIQRLRRRFGGRGFRVVLATQLYGHFAAQRELSPEQEIAKDREYFEHLGLDVPIAIAASGSSVVDGRAVFSRPQNDNDYQVGGIPQINIIDAKGIIRLIMVGYDDANEEKLAAFIEKLIRES